MWSLWDLVWIMSHRDQIYVWNLYKWALLYLVGLHFSSYSLTWSELVAKLVFLLLHCGAEIRKQVKSWGSFWTFSGQIFEEKCTSSSHGAIFRRGIFLVQSPTKKIIHNIFEKQVWVSSQQLNFTWMQWQKGPFSYLIKLIKYK